MSTTTQTPKRELRGEIEKVLNHREIAVAGTARWIASAISAPLHAVKRELEALRREGKITTRIPRSGELLFKLTDEHHSKWAALGSYAGRPSVHL